MSTINIEDQRRIDKLFEGLSDHVQRELSNAVKKSAIEIQRDAKVLAPVDEGRLRSDIKIKPGEDTTSSKYSMAWMIYNTVRYAPFLEFGTGPLGSMSSLNALAREEMRRMAYVHGPRGGWPPHEVMSEWAHRHGIPETAVYAIQLKIRMQGTKAHPYLFPAVDRNTERFRQNLLKALREGSRKGWRA